MKYLIDTNIIIDGLRKKENALSFLSKTAQHYLPCISLITVTEIIAGLRPEFQTKTNSFLKQFSIIGLNYEVSYLAGELIYKYARKGKSLHFQDALIAATAISEKLTLATANTKDFDFIEGLDMVKYIHN